MQTATETPSVATPATQYSPAGHVSDVMQFAARHVNVPGPVAPRAVAHATWTPTHCADAVHSPWFATVPAPADAAALHSC